MLYGLMSKEPTIDVDGIMHPSIDAANFLRHCDSPALLASTFKMSIEIATGLIDGSIPWWEENGDVRFSHGSCGGCGEEYCPIDKAGKWHWW